MFGKRLKDMLIGFVVGAVCFSSVAVAAVEPATIQAYFTNIKYYFDGVEKAPAAGKNGFIYQDTTYVPIRFVSESLGVPVEWDNDAHAIYIGKKPQSWDESGEPDQSGTDTHKLTDALAELQVFPEDNPWNTDISDYPVHPDSDRFLASIGLNTGLHPDFGTVWNGAPNGIPYVVVDGSQPKVNVAFTDYGDESDPGPYPIPPDAPIEGGPDGTGDRHVIAVDVENKKLYELFHAFPQGDAGWAASSGAVFDLTSNELRPKYWTSADAAGLPIFPGLVRYEEAMSGIIDHALRFTASRTQRGFIEPARHFASSRTDTDLPPMGLRVRLRSDYDLSGFSETNRTILQALKTYGMILADNGSNWYMSGAPDPRWDDDDLHELKQVKGSDFEVVYTGEIVR